MEDKRNMILKVLQDAGIEITELPPRASKAFSQIPYKTLVKNLVINDRAKQLTWGQLSIKYGLSIRQIKFICTAT